LQSFSVLIFGYLFCKPKPPMRLLPIMLLLWGGLFTSLQAQSFFTGTRVSPAQEAYDQGIAAMEEGTWGQALEYFEQALHEDTAFIDAHIAHGIACRQLYRQNEALKSFNKAINLYPRSLLAHEQLALLYKDMGFFEDAAGVYKQLLTHYPGYAAGFSGLAETYFSLGEKKSGVESSEAIEAFRASIQAAEMGMSLYLRTENNRNAADLRLLAARGYMEIGDYGKALKYMKASRRQLEDKPYYYYYLGLCYFRKGDKEKASEYLDQARSMGYRVPAYLENRLKNWNE